jgi:dipeptidase E
MKLLLTANGLSNPSIAKALFELVGKPAAETTIVFIPTAVNMAGGDKGWFIDDLYNIRKQGCKYIDIVDVSAIPQSVWQPRIEKGDVLFFSGGNTSHLMRCLKESGLFELLPELLKTRVYAGISAGTMIASPTIALSNEDKKINYEKLFGYRSEEALNFVDFYVRPHLNSPDYPYIQKEYLEKIAKKVGKPVYALDNESALKVIDGNIEVITEGEYLKS